MTSRRAVGSARRRPCRAVLGRRSSSSTRRPPRSTATSATPTGSRIRDPRVGPRRASSCERTAAEARGDPGRRPADRGAHHPRHAPGHRRARRSRRTTRTSTQLRVVDQMSGPQQLLPQLTQFQPVDTPERLEAFIDRLHAYPAFMAANADLLRRAALRADRARDRHRADHRPDRADARDPDRGRRIVPSMVKVRHDADRERIRDVVRDVVYPADAASSTTLRGEYRHASREEPGIWSAPERRPALPDRDPQLDDARAWTPRSSTRSGSTSSSGSRPSGARSPGRPASATTPRPTARRSTARPATRPRPRTSSSSARREDIERAMAVAPRYFGVLPSADCEVRPVEEYKEKDAPFAYYYPPSADGSRSGIYYANGYDLPSRKYTKLASTTYHEAAPGHHFQITLEMENPHLNRSAGSARGWSAAPTSRAGACTASGWPTRWACTATRRERFGMLDGQAWRAARLVVDTGLHALRWERQRSIDFLRTRRAVRDGRRDRDRPLHLLARPGAHLHDSASAEIERLRREICGAGRVALRPARVPRRGARPRLAAAGDARPRAADLGGDARLTQDVRVISSPPRASLACAPMDDQTAPASPAPEPEPARVPDVTHAPDVVRDRTRLAFLVVGGWLLLGVLVVGVALLAFVITNFADSLAECLDPPCAPVDPMDPMIFVALLGVAALAGLMGMLIAVAPTRRAFIVSISAAAAISVLSVLAAVLGGGLVRPRAARLDRADRPRVVGGLAVARRVAHDLKPGPGGPSIPVRRRTNSRTLEEPRLAHRHPAGAPWADPWTAVTWRSAMSTRPRANARRVLVILGLTTLVVGLANPAIATTPGFTTAQAPMLIPVSPAPGSTRSSPSETRSGATVSKPCRTASPSTRRATSGSTSSSTTRPPPSRSRTRMTPRRSRRRHRRRPTRRTTSTTRRSAC